MLVHRIKKILRDHSLLTSGETVVIGISGGIDSTALLHILHDSDLQLNITGAYIDHGLRPQETEREKEYLEALCRTLGVAFVVRSIDVQNYRQSHKCSLEEAARILRYQAFEHIRLERDATAVAVGHTADDQVEEFFLRLIRGSGLSGLSGMAYRHNRIIRPLLAEHKQTLSDYLDRQNIQCCHDSSNDDRTFLRNRIRQELLPILEQDFNPSIRQTVLQTTAILEQDEQLLATLSEDAANRLVTFENVNDEPPSRASFCQRDFLDCHLSLQRRILEKICWQMQSRPGYRQIEAILHLINQSVSGTTIHLAHGLRACKQGDTVVFSHPMGRQNIRGNGQEQLAGSREIGGPGTFVLAELGRILTVEITPAKDLPPTDETVQFLDGELLRFPLTLRPAQSGERMRPLGAPGKKKISRILSDLKIPRHERGRYPVLVCDRKVAAVAGLKIDHDFRVRPTTKQIVVLRFLVDE